MEAWYERFEYSSNPFALKPLVSCFVNLKDVTRQLIQGLASDSMIGLTGDVGSGKTTTLLFLKENITKPLTPIYYNCVESKKFDIDDILRKRKGLLDKLLKRRYGKKDNVLLFLDECQLLSERDLEQIKAYYDQGILKSVVFSSLNIDFLNESIKDRITMVLRIRPLTPEESVELIKRRIGNNINPFTEESMKLIGKASHYNPRSILKNCEKILFTLFTKNETPAYITPDIVARILNIPYKRSQTHVIERKRTIEETVRVPVEEVLIVEKNEKLDMDMFEIPQKEHSINIKHSIIDHPSMKNLSPLQLQIIEAVAERPMTYNELCQKLNKSRDTIAKQVSRLCLLSDADYMKRRGLEKPLLEKDRSTGEVKIGLSPDAKKIFEVIM